MNTTDSIVAFIASKLAGLDKTRPWWVGFDFDGTLAEYRPGLWPALGAPIRPMCELAEACIASGICIKIFTARVSDLDHKLTFDQTQAIGTWWGVNIGGSCPEITATKDINMALLFDDRVVPVATNTGCLAFSVKNSPSYPPRLAATPSDILEAGARTFQDRNAVYGQAYRTAGTVYAALFPEGLTLRTAEDFTRFLLFSAVVGKMQRYGANLPEGGHPDSAHDSMVYSAMLESVTKGIE